MSLSELGWEPGALGLRWSAIDPYLSYLRQDGYNVCQYRFGADSGQPGAYCHATLVERRNGSLAEPFFTKYTPLVFEPSPTEKLSRRERQYIRLSSELAECLKGRLGGRSLNLPPEVVDSRPWRWAGYDVLPMHTYYKSLPFDDEETEGSVRNKIRKAKKNGFRCERVYNPLPEGISICLKDAEERQGFAYDLTLRGIERLIEGAGSNKVRVYVCRDPNGSVAATRVVLSWSSQAIDWIAGTQTNRLGSGATQYLMSFMMNELYDDGIDMLDFGGGNIRSIARAKAVWGCSVVTFYQVRPRSIRGTVRGFGEDAASWWRSWVH